MRRVLVMMPVLALAGGVLALGGAAAQQERATLSPQNDSGVSGSVSLTPSGTQTILVVTTRGTDAGSVHPAHVHVGPDCDNYGAIEVNLTDVAVDIDGTGASSTTVDMSIRNVADGNHVVVVHRGPTLADDPTPIACAPLPVALAAPPPVAEEPAPAPGEARPPAEEPAVEPAPAPGEPAPAPAEAAEEAIAILPTTGSGGFLDQGSGPLPRLPFILLALAAGLLAAGAIDWRLSRTHR